MFIAFTVPVAADSRSVKDAAAYATFSNEVLVVVRGDEVVRIVVYKSVEEVVVPEHIRACVATTKALCSVDSSMDASICEHPASPFSKNNQP